MLNKKGEMTTQEILEIVLGAAVVLVMAVLLFRLLAPGFDVNKEYAEGVYEKLEQAAREVESSGRGEFNILDVPVDYGDSVFLVLFSGREYVLLSRYPVEIRNSGFMTYAKRSVGPLVGRGYYSLFVGAGVSPGVASEASSEVAKEVGVIAAQNMDDVLFETYVRSVVSNFGSRTGESAGEIIDEVLVLTKGRGLDSVAKWDALKTILSKHIPVGGIPNKGGTFKSVDTFLSSAKGLAKTNAMATLTKDVGVNLQVEAFIDDAIRDKAVAQKAYKEFTDETFGKGLGYTKKMSKLKSIVGDKVDDVVGLDDALKKIKNIGSRDVVKTLAKGSDDAADDLVRAATNKILAVRSIPADDAAEKIIENTLKGRGVTDDVIGKVVSASKGKLSGLGLRVAGKVLVVGFFVWEVTEYYNVAQKTQAWVLTALNNEEVSGNKWVVSKFLQAKKGANDMLCVCYVDDDYRRNVCSDCVGFGKPIVTSTGDNYWTFCEDVILSDRGGDVLLDSSVKERCKPSIAFTDDECEESRLSLVENLDSIKNVIVGSTAAVSSGSIYGALAGGLGGCFVGFIFGGPPGCVLVGGTGLKMGLAGGTLAGTYAAYKGVEFECDGVGHIYLKGD